MLSEIHLVTKLHEADQGLTLGIIIARLGGEMSSEAESYALGIDCLPLNINLAHQ